MTTIIDSRTVGEPARFLPFRTLAERFARMAAAPCDFGRVAVLVTRVDGGRRALVPRARLTAADGMPGDAWKRKTPAKCEVQLAVMQLGVAELLANGQTLRSSATTSFSTSISRRRICRSAVGYGRAACSWKSRPRPTTAASSWGRFGNDALCFVSQPALRPLNLRGIYLRAIADGEVAVGDAVEVVARPTAER